ncbi:hypothetical protein G9A89_000464 [Geosiphon pyriformis]|nr:hypothetical protein G9A89_000464 [Geosiphon pyriformis]
MAEQQSTLQATSLARINHIEKDEKTPTKPQQGTIGGERPLPRHTGRIRIMKCGLSDDNDQKIKKARKRETGTLHGKVVVLHCITTDKEQEDNIRTMSRRSKITHNSRNLQSLLNVLQSTMERVVTTK